MSRETFADKLKNKFTYNDNDPVDLPKSSEPSETPKQHEIGCVVCKHIVRCEPNPFGICRLFEYDNELRKENNND